MPSLKDLRNRISSVKQTQKITSAMKLVAGSKLRRAQQRVEAARPFSEKMAAMLANLAAGVKDLPSAPPLLAGTGKADTHLIIVATADRGLCGGFNSSIVRAARRRIAALRADGKTVKLLCVGRKARDMLRRDHRDLILDTVEGIGRRQVEFAEAEAIAERVLAMFEQDEFDVCWLIFNRYRSAIAYQLTERHLIPVETEGAAEEAGTESEGPVTPYEYEPDEETILAELLPRNLAVQVYGALVENSASEQGARMTAMDSATRNAGEMIRSLSLRYNRTRQAQITKELIEIVSGAEALEG
jgi:F-type H+-transporting ATPase subunit gamma